MAYPAYREFAVPGSGNKDKDELNVFWSRVAAILNPLGPIKPAQKWQRSWADKCAYATKQALQKGRPVPSGSGGDFAYTSDNPEVDAIMNIIGWEAAFSSGYEMEDCEKENENTSPLSTPTCFKRKASLSPLGRSASPLNPFLHTQGGNRSSTSPVSAGSPAAINTFQKEIEKLSQAVERNTEMLFEMKGAIDNMRVIQVVDATSTIVQQTAVTEEAPAPAQEEEFSVENPPLMPDFDFSLPLLD
ncbi:50S ribosomal protein L32 [Frankliniella fusca]|uniref:50S ribosomal protein L32 n=1 Tax=Frankliniella fusca TaxID=407009 RepID=A0AAE1LGV5_9NEOP|nr:50S ribosomal protein L32 [Frankliniella fusca]